MKELKMSRRGAKRSEPYDKPEEGWATTAPEMTTAVSPGETLAMQSDEPYVTLVVQVVLAKPEPSEPAKAARSAKSKTKPKLQDKKKPSKSRAAE